MYSEKKLINPIRVVDPKCYAYSMPDIPIKTGWVKIGKTERDDVEIRINEQLSEINLRHIWWS